MPSGMTDPDAYRHWCEAQRLLVEDQAKAAQLAGIAAARAGVARVNYVETASPAAIAAFDSERERARLGS